MLIKNKLRYKLCITISFAFACSLLLSTNSINGYDCKQFCSVVSQKCTVDAVTQCDPDGVFIAPSGKRACSPAFQINKVYVGNFGCNCFDSPFPLLFSKCVPEYATDEMGTYQITTNCVDRTYCSLTFDILTYSYYCIPGPAKGPIYRAEYIIELCNFDQPVDPGIFD